MLSIPSRTIKSYPYPTYVEKAEIPTSSILKLCLASSPPSGNQHTNANHATPKLPSLLVPSSWKSIPDYYHAQFQSFCAQSTQTTHFCSVDTYPSISKGPRFPGTLVTIQSSCNSSQPHIYTTRCLEKLHAPRNSMCLTKPSLVDVLLATPLLYLFNNMVNGDIKYCVQKRVVPFLFQNCLTRECWGCELRKMPFFLSQGASLSYHDLSKSIYSRALGSQNPSNRVTSVKKLRSPIHDERHRQRRVHLFLSTLLRLRSPSIRS